MKYYLAPMEGITTYIYRNAYAHYFGQVDKYFTPFIANKKMSSRELRDILPEHNKGINLVPQILTNKAVDFLSIAERLASYGYQTVNLNLGCPSGTVTAKKRGSGFLSVPNELDAFLYEIYEKCPLKISIKTRIGISQLEEWDALMDIYSKYPIEELIIHTRLQQEFYNGKTHPEAYATAAENLSRIPLCYNGDIMSVESQEDLLSELKNQSYTAVDSVMIGRGIIRNPGLLWKLSGSPLPDKKQHLLDFHNEILEEYRKIMPGDLPVLFKMKDLWTYMSQSFTNAEKYLKKIRKANRIPEYEIAVSALFREQEIID